MHLAFLAPSPVEKISYEKNPPPSRFFLALKLNLYPIDTAYLHMLISIHSYMCAK